MPAIWEMVQIVPAESVGNVTSGKEIIGGDVPRSNIPSNNKFFVILIPHTGEVSTEWAIMLRNLQMVQGSHFTTSRGSPIDVTRDQMVNMALEQGFEWMFFLDSDVLPPVDVLPKLLAHNLPIVAGMYKARKHEGFTWAAWMRGVTADQKIAFAPIQSWGGATLFECDVTGAGCLLVHRSVFLKIKEMYPDLPLFYWANNRTADVLDKMNIPDPAMREVSEDFWFCLLAKKCGFKIVMDPGVRCGHLSVVKIGTDSITLPGA